MMVEVNFLDDVGQGYDIAQCTPELVGQTLGRHINDHVTSFYTHNPSNFMVEYGWGGRSIDPDNWTPKEVVEGPEPVGPRAPVAAAGGRARPPATLRMKLAAGGPAHSRSTCRRATTRSRPAPACCGTASARRAGAAMPDRRAAGAVKDWTATGKPPISPPRCRSDSSPFASPGGQLPPNGNWGIVQR